MSGETEADALDEAAADIATVTVGARMDQKSIERIDGLRPMFPVAAGGATSRSDVLRALVDIGLELLDPELVAQIDQARGARSRGIFLRDLCREFFAAQRTTKRGAVRHSPSPAPRGRKK